MAVYGRAKRAQDKPLNKKKITTIIILMIVIIITACLIISKVVFSKKDEQVANTNIIQDNIIEETETAPEPEQKQDEIVDVDMPETMGNYKVIGQLVIDKIGVTQNILNISDDNSLALSVAQFYGPNLNAPGNFCITGHNWASKLKRVSEMQVGDTFYLINRETKTKVNYQIYNIYTCEPEDLSCLDQNNDGKREATLITCNPGGKTRLICKAREI